METIANESKQTKRKRFTPEERQDVLRRFRQSGLRQQEFVVQEGISKASLGKWLQAERWPAKARVKPVEFRELTLAQPGARWALEVISPQNWTLRVAQGISGQTLEELLGALPC
jgi:transposase-like protein